MTTELTPIGRETAAAIAHLEDLRIEVLEILEIGSADPRGYLDPRAGSEFKRVAWQLVQAVAGYLRPELDFSDNIKHLIGGIHQTPTVQIVRDVEGQTRAAISHLQRFGVPRRSKRVPYVSVDRIADLRRFIGGGSGLDTKRLVRLCEELNEADEHDCLMSVAFLTRAILDHVPPVFGRDDFNQVLANTKFDRSVKDHLQILNEQSRRVADRHLHTRMRRRENLPDRQQVTFSSALDVLLGEVLIRIGENQVS